MQRTARTLSWLSVALAAATLLPSAVAAQITSPGSHSRYVAEVEPHLVVQWAHEPFCGDEGLGLGGRASFPVLDSVIPTLNNTLAIGVGLDFAFFDGDCPGFRGFDDAFDATSIWVPFDVQWNLFFSNAWSMFIELGLGLEHWNADYCYGGNCGDVDDTDVHLVLWLGGRYKISDAIGITMRVGTPSFLLGVAFYL